MEPANGKAGRVRSYKDLIVWQQAMTLVELVYDRTQVFPKSELYGLTSQMRRCAISIPSNIAEGQARNSRGEFLQFIGHERGSLAELDTQIILAKRLGFLVDNSSAPLSTKLADVGRLLNALRTSLTPSP